MKLWAKHPPEPPISLRDRAQNVKRASVLLQEMRLAGTLPDGDYELLSAVIRWETDAVAEGLRNHGHRD